MGGIPKFKLNCYTAGLTLPNYGQSLFKQTWDFFKQLESVGYVLEIARNNGSGGTGTDFWDGANPFGPNAWALFRFNTTSLRSFPYYVFFQYATSSNFGTAPGSPGLITGSSGTSTSILFGMQMASAYDSMGNPANPWGGTTGSLGSDTKGSPVWIAPVGGYVDVYPMSNNPGGSYSSLKENCVGYISNSSHTNIYTDFIADEDNFCIILNKDSAAVDRILFGGGYYIPITNGVTTKNRIFLFTSNNNANFVDRTNVWGTSVGTNSSREGGCGGADLVYGRSLDFAWDTGLERSTPNIYTTPANQYPLYPISIQAELSQVGYLDPIFWRVGYGMNPKDTKTGLTRMVYDATITANTVRLVVPWDGVTPARGTGTNRDGIIS